MTILDTLIAQSEQFSPPSRHPPTRDVKALRQEVMGALALFTGGRSLANQGQEHTDGIDLHGADSPAPSLPPAPDPPAIRENTGFAGQKQFPPQKAASPVQPHPTTQAARDWSALLARSDHTTRQALKEVEPTLHNAEQSLTRFMHLQAQQKGESHPETDPTPILQGLSAMMTARSILNLHTSGDRSSAHGTIGKQTYTPHQPITPHFSTPLPPPIGATSDENNAPSVRQENPLQRLPLALAHTGKTLSQMMPPQGPACSPIIPNKPPLGQSLSQLIKHVDAASPPRQVITHNTTTHSPTIHITMEAGHSRPQDVARAIEASTIHALTRQTLAQTG